MLVKPLKGQNGAEKLGDRDPTAGGGREGEKATCIEGARRS